MFVWSIMQIVALLLWPSVTLRKNHNSGVLKRLMVTWHALADMP